MKSPPLSERNSRQAVVLVEDDVHFCAYLANVVNDAGRYVVVAQASSAEVAATWPATLAPRLALIDIGLPGVRGTQLVARLIERYPELLVVMLTARAEDDLILEAIRGGAVGYVLKGTPSAEIVEALDSALAGGAPMSPSIARRVLTLMRTTPSGATATTAVGTRLGDAELRALTEREADVLGLVAAGATDKEAAAKLGVSVSAVKAHLANIYAKWRVRSRTEAAIKFTQAGR